MIECFKKIFFNFTILYWFCHTSTWICHRCTCVPHPEPPSHLPPHPIPLGHPSAPAPSTLYHASNLNWRFISHMIIYMFQCHFPKSSNPRLLPQNPKDCSIHLCLFCYLACRVIIQFICSIMSDSPLPHEPQHARPPCPSPTTGVHPNPCPLCWWCHPTISSSVVPFSSNLSHYQGLFKWVSYSHQAAKVLEFQLQHQSFQWIFRTDFL